MHQVFCSRQWMTSWERALDGLPKGEGIAVREGTRGVDAGRIVDHEFVGHPQSRTIGALVALRAAVAGVEIRWMADAAGGQVRQCQLEDESTDEWEHREVARVLKAERILWGTVAEVGDGWARLFDTRVGSLWVPAPPDAGIGSHLALRSQEVVVEVTGSTPGGAVLTGNRSVTEELLTGDVVVASEMRS